MWTRLSADELFGFDAERTRYTSDGSRLVYVAQVPAGQSHIEAVYSVPAAGGGLTSFRVSPAGDRVAYLADHDTRGVTELYSAPIDGSAAPVKLNALLDVAADVSGYGFIPGGERVVFRAGNVLSGPNELFSAPAGGAEAAVTLNGALPPGGSVYEFLVSPAGERVVFRADAAVNNVFELYSVPAAGGEAPVRLSGTLAAGTEVTREFAISPDGGRAVFIIKQPGLEGLFSVPVEGGAPQQVNHAFAGMGGFAEFAIARGGSRVGYIASEEPLYQNHLYLAPSEGGAVADVCGALDGNGYVRHFLFSPTGHHVAMAADKFVAGRVDLIEVHEEWTARVDSSAAGGKLNAGAATLQVGDDGRHRQYRSFLSFDTSSLPDEAVVLAATLQLRYAAGAGPNPLAPTASSLSTSGPASSATLQRSRRRTSRAPPTAKPRPSCRRRRARAGT